MYVRRINKRPSYLRVVPWEERDTSDFGPIRIPPELRKGGILGRDLFEDEGQVEGSPISKYCKWPRRDPASDFQKELYLLELVRCGLAKCHALRSGQRIYEVAAVTMLTSRQRRSVIKFLRHTYSYDDYMDPESERAGIIQNRKIFKAAMRILIPAPINWEMRERQMREDADTFGMRREDIERLIGDLRRQRGVN